MPTKSGAALLFSGEVRHPSAASASRVLKKAAREQLATLGISHRELSLSLVSDARIRALNKQHRKKDQATDVLSFPQEEAARAASSKGPIGDVVISLQTAIRQAKEGGWPLAVELRRLLAHGLLHCLGHDHLNERDAKKMDAAERKLLGREGMVGASYSAPSMRR